MARQFVCAYANCQKQDLPIILTMPDERSRFCCSDHAAAAMLRRAWIAAHGEKANEIMAIEKAFRVLIGDGSELKRERPLRNPV